MASETDICNLALAHLGEASITSLNEDSVSARACALHFTLTRDEVLRSHRWNFAVKRALLSRNANAPAFGWSYAYRLPADCLRALDLNAQEDGDFASDEYTIESGELLTNAVTAKLVYVRKIEDTSIFDALFTKAFAVKLAIALSETIRGTTGKTAELTTAYERIVAPLARRVDANEGRRRKGLALDSMAIRARGGRR